MNKKNMNKKLMLTIGLLLIIGYIFTVASIIIDYRHFDFITVWKAFLFLLFPLLLFMALLCDKKQNKRIAFVLSNISVLLYIHIALNHLPHEILALFNLFLLTNPILLSLYIYRKERKIRIFVLIMSNIYMVLFTFYFFYSLSTHFRFNFDENIFITGFLYYYVVYILAFTSINANTVNQSHNELMDETNIQPSNDGSPKPIIEASKEEELRQNTLPYQKTSTNARSYLDAYKRNRKIK